MGEVGGNTLGYYGCAFAPDDADVIAHGYLGAFQMWKRDICEVKLLLSISEFFYYEYSFLKHKVDQHIAAEIVCKNKHHAKHVSGNSNSSKEWEANCNHNLP